MNSPGKSANGNSGPSAVYEVLRVAVESDLTTARIMTSLALAAPLVSPVLIEGALTSTTSQVLTTSGD